MSTSVHSLFTGYGFGDAGPIPVQTSSHPALNWYEASGWGVFVLKKREESPIFTPPPPPPSFILCSSLHLHVLQPCYNSLLLRLMPRSRSTAPGPRSRCITYIAKSCIWSPTTSVIGRNNRLFISAAENGLKMLLLRHVVSPKCSRPQTRREILGHVRASLRQNAKTGAYNTVFVLAMNS